jgi:Beta-galactosidase/beta-glucuronidase
MESVKTITLAVSFLTIALIIITGYTTTQNKEKLVSLSGDWRIALGDNMKFASPDYDDADWEKIYVPSSWQREGFRNYHGYAWYRRTFKLNFDGKAPVYLELGRVDDVDEVYVNGHLIGRTGGFPPNYFTAYNYPRKYFVPTEHLNLHGRNVIAVRVYDEGGEGGIVGSAASIGLYSYPNFSDNSVNLFGLWNFHLGDDTAWASPEFKDDDWEKILVPATWESQGFADYDGYAWYRRTIRLPEKLNPRDMLLLIGKIDDVDQVYVNGKLIGGTGRIEKRWASDQEWRKFRTYEIPDGLLRPGKENVIAVRVYDQVGNGGIYEGPVTLLPQSEYKEFWRNYRANRSTGENFVDWLSSYFD